MKKLKISLISILFFSSLLSLGSAADVFFGALNEDLYYNDEVLIDGVILPQDLTASEGTSQVLLDGAGTLTVGDRATRGNLRVTVVGGTTIASRRVYLDSDPKRWWEGAFPAPKRRSAPSASIVRFESEAKHPNSRIYPVVAFEMGQRNEAFSFSRPAKFVLPVNEMEGMKLWIAYKSTVAKEEDENWTIKESDYCIVRKGICIVEASEVNGLALIKEFFTVCPRSKSSDTKVVNGFISGPPLCTIECYNGYELNEDQTACVPKSKSTTKEEEFLGGEYEAGQPMNIEKEGKVYEIRPGDFKYQYARGALDRYIDSTGLEGEDKRRVDKQNAALLETYGDWKNKVAPPKKEEHSSAGNENDFFNFYMKIFGGGKKSDNVFPAEGSLQGGASEGGEVKGEITENNGEYGSAPLLPSTGGAGLFIGLTLVGVILMILSYRKGNQ